MNKLFFILGFLFSLPAYFNDSVAELVQNLGGGLWVSFSSIGVAVYPIYLALYILPIFFIIALISSKLKLELRMKNIFLKLLYGFIASSMFFELVVLLAISQFRFTQ